MAGLVPAIHALADVNRRGDDTSCFRIYRGLGELIGNYHRIEIWMSLRLISNDLQTRSWTRAWAVLQERVT